MSIQIEMVDGIAPPQTSDPSLVEVTRTQKSDEEPQDSKVVIDEEEIGIETLKDASEQLNEVVRIFQKDLSFSVDETTDRLVVKVIDRVTGEVIRQVPPETMLEALGKIHEMLGLLLDEHA